MKRQHARRASNLVVERDQAVVAIPLVENGREVVEYAVDPVEAATDQLPESIQDAISLAGAWSDLDWDDTVEALERIRHESRPTPPITSLP